MVCRWPRQKLAPCRCRPRARSNTSAGGGQHVLGPPLAPDHAAARSRGPWRRRPSLGQAAAPRGTGRCTSAVARRRVSSRASRPDELRRGQPVRRPGSSGATVGASRPARRHAAWRRTSSRSRSVTSAASAATSGASMRRGRGDVDRELGRHPSRAARQQHDPVAQAGRLPHVVGDEQDREAAARPHPLELVVEDVAGHGVEGAEGLVHEQDVGVLGQGPGQRHPLAHAAGQLVGPLRRRSRPGARGRAARRPARGARPGGRPAAAAPARRCGGTVSHGNSAGSWNIRAVRPSTSTRPAVGRSSPATSVSSVDLPQPEAPTRQTNSPARTSSEMRSRASTALAPAP